MIACIAIGVVIGSGIGAALGYFGKCSSGTCPFTANPLRGMFFGAALGALIAYNVGCNWASSPSENTGVSQGGMLIETEEDFAKYVLESEKPVLVSYFSPTCPPCRKLAPTIVTLERNYRNRAGIYKIDVSKLFDLASNEGVRAVPATAIFSGGKEVERILGNRSYRTYSSVLDRLLSESPDKTN